jgi:hypothetical protein
MWRTLGSVTGFLIGVVILLISLWVDNQNQVHAEVVPDAVRTVVQTPSKGLAVKSSVLTGSPGHLIRAVDNRLRVIRSRNSMERAAWELVYADQRFRAAEILVSGGKYEAGIKTAQKATAYLVQARDHVAGEVEDERSEYIWQAIAAKSDYYEEVVLRLRDEVTVGEQAMMERMLSQVRRIQDESKARAGLTR